ncbi:MAG: helix-turn-helix domain-containing protein [Reyranellaceae bacterium]
MVALYDARFPNGGGATEARPAPSGSAPPCGPRQREVRLSRQARRIADLEAERDLLLSTIDDLRRRLAARSDAAGGRQRSASPHARRRALERVLMQRLLAIVARQAGIDLALMASDRRGRDAAWPRQMFCFLAREHCRGLSLPAIGAAIDRDHSNVIHSVRAVQRRLAAGETATVALYEACAGDVGTAVAEIAARMPPETGADTETETGAGDGAA